MEKSSLLCILVLLVASAAAFIIKDCEDCQPQVALLCTEKRKKNFLIFRELRRDRVQSQWPTVSSYIVKYLPISSYIRKPFLLYDFAPDPIGILYGENVIFFFISVLVHCTSCCNS
jgi:hypothetical protein